MLYTQQRFLKSKLTCTTSLEQNPLDIICSFKIVVLKATLATKNSTLLQERLLAKEGNLFKNYNIKEDFKDKLESTILEKIKTEDITPTAP